MAGKREVLGDEEREREREGEKWENRKRVEGQGREGRRLKKLRGKRELGVCDCEELQK